MGYYINPKDQEKEAFLHEKGTPLKHAPKWEDVPKDMMAVCLVDNGYFTAAAVAYSERELKEFSSPTDQRPKKWYLCAITSLKPVTRNPVTGALTWPGGMK